MVYKHESYCSEEIIIPGNPIALKRHRHTKLGHSYNSQCKLMDQISFIVKSQYLGLQLTGPLSINIIFYMQIPKSLSLKKQKQLDGTYHFKKPDLDNLEKMLADCVVRAGNILIDDSQISMIKSSKVYSFNPRTEFRINVLNEPRTEIIIEPAE